MPTYISELATELRDLIGPLAPNQGPNVRLQPNANVEQRRFFLMRAIAEGLQSLDVRDFLPNHRARFAITKQRIVTHSEGVRSWPHIRPLLDELLDQLQHYGNIATVQRPFPWIVDAALLIIVQRDYAEVVAKLFPSAAWKSTVILAGSVCEAVLFDVLTGSPARLAASRAHANVPPGNPDDWRLAALVRFARQRGLIPPPREDMFDVSLREYRNFVHPKREIRGGAPCGEGEAFLAVGALIALCDHFDAHPPA